LFSEVCSSGTVTFLSMNPDLTNLADTPEKDTLIQKKQPEVPSNKQDESEMPKKSSSKSEPKKSLPQGTTKLDVKSVSYELNNLVDFNCPICEDLSDNECTDYLMTYIQNLGDKERLNLEKILFHNDCSDLSESYCLAYFDELLLSLSTQDKNEIFLEACLNGVFPEIDTVLPVTQLTRSENVEKSAASRVGGYSSTDHATNCDMCDSLNQDECLTSMTDYLSKLADKNRLDVEKIIFGSELCDSMTNHQCLSYFDSYISELSQDELYAKLFDACDAGMFEETAFKVDSSTVQASCSSCHGLSDSDCLLALVSSFETFNNHVRMTTEKVIFQDDCTGMNDNTCLKYLNSKYEELSDEEKLTALKVACDAGLIHASASFSTVDSSESYSMIFWGWVSAGFFVFGIVIYRLRSQKKNQYLTIPDIESDYEFEI